MAPTISAYRISVQMRVAAGFTETGSFLIGTDKSAATALFDQLEGRKHENPSSLLRLCLITRENEQDYILQLLDCTLDEMAENIRTITKETFRLLNLEPNTNTDILL